MAVIRNLVVKIAADISQLSKGLQQAKSKLLNVSNSLSSIGTSLSLKVTAPLVMLGKTALSTAANFEQSMANANSVAGGSSEELEKMSNVARQLGKETVFSASQAADAMYYMASAGYKVEQMEASLASVLNLSAATQNELAFTTDTVISSLNQFSLNADQAERVTNVYAAAIGNSQATLDKLAYSMRYAGPVANSLGYSIEQTTAALGLLYNSGFRGEQAGTILRSSLSRLLKPTSQINSALEELNLSFDDVNPATKSFADIIRALEDAGVNTAQAVSIFGQEAGPGMMALISQGADALEDMEAKITGTQSASQMAEKQLDTFQGASKLLKSQLEELSITIGNMLIPILQKLISGNVMSLVERFNNLSDKAKELVVKIGVITAAIGPLIIILSKVIKAVSVIVKVFGLLASPIGLIVVAIGLIIAALVKLFKTNENFRNSVLNIWEKIKEKITFVISYIIKWWDNNGKALLNNISNIFNKILDVIINVGSFVISVIDNVISSLKELWKNNEGLRKALAKIWKGIKKNITSAIKSITKWWKANGEKILNSISNVFSAIWDIILKVTDGILKSITVFLGYVSPIWQQLKTLFASLWNVILKLWDLLKPVFTALGGVIAAFYSVMIGTINGIIQALGPLIQAIISAVEFVIEIISALISVITGDFDGAWEHLKSAGQSFVDFFVHLWEGISNYCKGFIEGITNFFIQFGVDLEGIFIDIGDSITGFFEGIWKGIDDFCIKIWESVTDVFEDVKKYIKNLTNEAYNWGRNLIISLGDGIKSAAQAVIDGVKDIGNSISEFLGFSSPTKKGEGRFADKWMPNLMNMLKEGIDKGLPDIERSAGTAAYTLQGIAVPDISGYNNQDNIVNSLITALSSINSVNQNNNQPVELSIDGQVFARMILPNISREFKRKGVKLKGGGL